MRTGQAVVSVWLGAFADEAAFFAYIERTFDDHGSAFSPFERDLGVRFDEDFREAEYFPDGVADLETAFSLFTFGEAFAADAARQAFAAPGAPEPLPNAVLLLYAVHFTPTPSMGERELPLRFVGAFATHAE
jgi:hypothetical protein